MLNNYVDDQRLFLMQSLRRIEHLSNEKDATEDMLIKLAYCFKQRVYEKG
jgi:CRP-like cAMP-binding protein